MIQNNQKATRSLFLTLFVVGCFLSAIIFIQTPKQTDQISKLDRVYAGAIDPVDTTTPPIGGSDETVIKTTVPTKSPSPKATSTASPSAVPIATFFLPTTTEAPIVQSPTPVPTFSLDLPGETTPTQTAAPIVQQTKNTNNTMPFIIAGVIGAILLIAGIILFILKKKKDSDDFTPPNTPSNPPAQPFQTPVASPNQPNATGDGSFSTPYDQYINNQPNAPKNQ